MWTIGHFTREDGRRQVCRHVRALQFWTWSVLQLHVLGDNHRTSPTEPLKIRPDRPDQHLVHPGVNLSAALLAAGCDYIEIQAHSSVHNHNASRILPENCNVHGGCFHFMSLESIFHSFLSLRHIKTEEMKTIWDILVSPLSPIFNFHHRRHE